MARIYNTEEGGRALVARYRRLLSKWPVACEQLLLPTSQGETFVMASGPKDAPPIVLLHGAGANALFWMRDVAAWSKNFRVYAVDIIGEPGLSAPSRPPLESDLYAKWLNELLDALSIARANLIGVSFGGWLALDFATRHPERMENLVLLCPGGVGRQKYGFIFKAAFLLLLGDWGRRKAMVVAMGPQVSNGDASRPAYLLSVYKEFRPRRVRLPIFSGEKLKRLTMPVLLIVGAHDAMLDSQGTLARMKRNVANLTAHYLAETGHLIAGQTGTISDFLRGTR
jgi:pimeloyl-ACP methyl ester carboxylesterase